MSPIVKAKLDASINPLSLEDLQSLQEIIGRASQCNQIIERAKAIGLPVDEHEQKNATTLAIAQKTIEEFFGAGQEQNQEENGAV